MGSSTQDQSIENYDFRIFRSEIQPMMMYLYISKKKKKEVIKKNKKKTKKKKKEKKHWIHLSQAFSPCLALSWHAQSISTVLESRPWL